jgi:hypothetical protein
MQPEIPARPRWFEDVKPTHWAILLLFYVVDMALHVLTINSDLLTPVTRWASRATHGLLSFTLLASLLLLAVSVGGVLLALEILFLLAWPWVARLRRSH